MIKVNLEKAKEIHRNHIREARKKHLQELDVEFMKAIEENDTAKMEEVKNKKKFWRDMTKCSEIECAECIDDLKAHWPDCLECECPYVLHK